MTAIPLARALVVALLIAGCSAPVTPPSATVTPTTTSSSPSGAGPGKAPPFVPPRNLCALALPGRTLLGWGTTTVGELRAYRYGPQHNPPPLADAFPGVPDDAAGTLCATRAAGPHATAWWGVLDGTAKHLITIDGAGEGRRLGEVTRPPQVP